MRDGVNLYEQVDAMEAMIKGIQKARRSHPILSIIASESDSARLARAAFDALEAEGFAIVRKRDATLRNPTDVADPQ